MNRISLIARDGRPRFDIVVDGRRLAEHFVGRLGAHPTEVAAIGWSGPGHGRIEQRVIDQLLGIGASILESGRVPVLVCERCGDLDCGALAVRIERDGNIVRWTDWACENGYEPAKPVEWPTYPETFEFDLDEYQRVFTAIVQGEL